jgi:hypothetical protein
MEQFLVVDHFLFCNAVDVHLALIEGDCGLACPAKRGSIMATKLMLQHDV